MLQILRSILKNLPTVTLALALAITVWISAVTQTDPTIEKVYPRAIPVELVGQDPGIVIVSDAPAQVTITLRAPNTIWNRLTNEQIPVRAIVDLTGLPPGDHSLPVQIQVGIQPVAVVSYMPRTYNISLEHLSLKTYPVKLSVRGELGIGFQSGELKVDPQQVSVSGPESLVERISEVRATLDLNSATENIRRSINLQPVDVNGNLILGVTVTPDKVTASVDVSQRGGYRNVVVKVVLTGKVVDGYRVTNINVFPPAITVFSADPKLVESLPGFVETAALNLDGVKDDLDVRLPLSLPPGVSVVGEQTVGVQVGVASIEGSLTLASMPVTVIGLGENLEAKVAPETVDVFLTGPVPLLSSLAMRDVRVVVDLLNSDAGVYQRVPRVELPNSEIKVQSILPGSVEVTISPRRAPTRTPSSSGN